MCVFVCVCACVCVSIVVTGSHMTLQRNPRFLLLCPYMVAARLTDSVTLSTKPPPAHSLPHPCTESVCIESNSILSPDLLLFYYYFLFYFLFHTWHSSNAFPCTTFLSIKVALVPCMKRSQKNKFLLTPAPYL